MPGQVLGSHFGAIQGLVLPDAVHDAWQAARVIHLCVVADHDIDLAWIDDAGNVVQQLVGELMFDRIDQGHFLIDDQIRIIAGTQRRGVAMEVLNIPVVHPYIINIFRNFNRFHFFSNLFSSIIYCHIAFSTGEQLKWTGGCDPSRHECPFCSIQTQKGHQFLEWSELVPGQKW